MKKIRKNIDILEDDFAALQLLAARQNTNLKNCIERFLHQLADMAIKNELEHRINQIKDEIDESETDKKES